MPKFTCILYNFIISHLFIFIIHFSKMNKKILHSYFAFLSYKNNILYPDRSSSALNSTVISLHFHPLDPARKMRSAHWETVFWWVTEVREKVTWCDGLLSEACKKHKFIPLPDLLEFLVTSETFLFLSGRRGYASYLSFSVINTPRNHSLLLFSGLPCTWVDVHTGIFLETRIVCPTRRQRTN